MNAVFQKTELKNGIRIVTECHPQSRAAAVGFFVEIGTRDEPKNLKGSAHFIEHLVFKGTKSLSSFEIAKSLEAVGGDLNAYTTREYTCFHALSLNEHLEISLGVLCELVCFGKFSNKDFENERQVILQEADMAKEQLDEWIYDLLFQGAYQGHPLGETILGEKASLQKLTRTKVKNHYNRTYCGENMIVAVSGNVDHQKVVEFVEARCQTAASIQIPKRIKPVLKNFKKLIEKPSEQAHLLLSWPASSFTDQKRFESYILNAVLGGGMTSRLYQNIREDLGLAYTVYSSLQSFTDSGLLSIYVGTSKAKAPRALQQIKIEMERLVESGLSSEELDFYKRQIKGQILLGADDMDNRMNSLGINEMVFKQYRPVEKVIEEIDALTPQHIRSYIDQDLDLKNLKAILLGDVMSKGIEKQLLKL